MFNIFWHSLKEKKFLVFIYYLTGFIFLWMFVAFFPNVQKSATNLNEMIKGLPQGLIKAFGLDPKFTFTLEGFLASKHFSLMWPIILIALVNSLGGASLVGEIEKKTIAILLSQPISRIKIYLAKFLSNCFYLFIFVISSTWTTIPLAQIYNISYIGKNYFKISLVGLFFGLALLGIVLFFSSFSTEKSKVNFLLVGLLIVMYFIYIISLLKENLDKLKYFSFFYYFNYTDLLVHGKIDYLSLWVFGLIFIFTFIFGLIIFNKRDITV